MQTGMSVIACFNSPTGMYSAAFALVYIHLFIINYQRLICSLTAVTFLMREEDIRGNCTQQIWKSMSHFLWCFSNQASHHATYTMAAFQPLIDDFSYCRPSCLWSFNKFVFTPTEQVGHTTVTHGTDVVPSQTTQSETPGFCVHL